MGSLCITRRKNKTGFVWQYRFEVGTADGKRQWESKSGFSTKKEAAEAGKRAQQQFEKQGVRIPNQDILYDAFLDDWLESEIKKTCKPGTVDTYQKKIRLYIKPALGSLQVRAVTKQEIREFLYQMYDQGFSPNTLSICKGIISKSFQYAADLKLIEESPAINLRLPKGGLPPSVPTRLSPHVYIKKEEMAQILDRFPKGTSPYLALMLGYHCGLRLGEAFGLIWDDINLEQRTLAVSRQIQWMPKAKGSGYWYFSEPKYASYRVIDLDDEITDILQEEYRQQRAQREQEGYRHYYISGKLITDGIKPQAPQIFHTLYEEGETEKKTDLQEISLVHVRFDGSYINPRTMKHTSRVIHGQLGLCDFDYHSLRHTHSTMLLEQGAPLVYIQRRLGHAAIDVTANIYTNHLTDEIRRQGNRTLNGLF